MRSSSARLVRCERVEDVPELQRQEIERYLSSVLGRRVTVLSCAPLGENSVREEDVKGFGYGTLVRIDFELEGGERRSAVVHTLRPASFGHEHMADRAQELLWEHQAFNHLPRHLRSLDVGGFQSGGGMVSLGKIEEFCLLTEYAEGESYALDLERLRDMGALTGQDLARADALCDYLVEIHKVRGSEAGLYLRRIRELVGHGECIMGIADSYPSTAAGFLEKVEHLCVGWRWRLKRFPHRLRQVHGDFHPWNILFRSAAEFSVLDRSRGEYGDPADDVASLTLNYLFFSLQRSARLEGALETLFCRFWDRYLEKSGDREMLEVVAPFLAFRGLVMASPLWYPALPEAVRRKLQTFIVNVLESESFDPQKANSYCGV
jgi:streptomycin 6-kinase